VIPESVTYEEVTYSVTSIGSYAFASCRGMTSVTIPNSVTSIGEIAFADCSGLTSVTIPNSVNIIERNAFLACFGLTSITIPNSVETIGESAFSSCYGLTSVTLGNGLTSIGRWAFSNCYNLTSIIIPNSVTGIGSLAFEDCSSLTSINIPSSVTLIERSIVAGCTALTSITVDSENKVYDSRDNCNAIINSTTNELVAGCKSTIIPDNVTSLGLGAFEHCRGLTAINIPNGITKINDDAFYGCTGLTSIIIPSSVSYIRRTAFAYCSGLSTITVESGNQVYDSRDNCNAIIETRSNTLIAGCKNTIIPNTIETIFSAFYGCSDLKSINIPNSVTCIGVDAFRESGLRSISISNSVTTIDFSAFGGCNSLSVVYIPESVKTIGDWAFGNCEPLRDVYCYAQNVPETSADAFRESHVEYKALHVPAGSIEAYKAAAPWSGFGEIVGVPQHSLVYKVDGEVYKSYQICEGASITPEAEPTNEGYVFSGWSTIPATMPAENVTVTGTFSLITDEDEITIKEIGKTTWCSKYDLDFTNVAGIKAYIAMGYDDNDKTIWLARVMKVPAGTGLLVKGDAGTYKIPHVNVRAYYTNMLVGNLGETIKIEETDGDKTNYYLSGKDGTFVSVSGNANIGKNKAYLQLPTSIFAGTRSIGISYDDEDGTTSIRNLTPALSEGDGAWYTLQGQRVAKPGKGLYIHNGKKVIIK
jgi:hypothetical protein